MAIDTAEKRKSLSGVGLMPFVMPGVTPNSDKDAEWRSQVGWRYSGIATAGIVTQAYTVVRDLSGTETVIRDLSGSCDVERDLSGMETVIRKLDAAEEVERDLSGTATVVVPFDKAHLT